MSRIIGGILAMFAGFRRREPGWGKDGPMHPSPAADVAETSGLPRRSRRAWATLGLALLAGVVLLLLFSPRYLLWRSLTLGVYWNTAEVWRALVTLQQIQDPFAPIQEPMHQIVRFRLLIPVIWHYTGLPTLLALALPYAGALLTLWLIAHEVARRSGDLLLAGAAAILLGATSWFFVSTGWLAYYDSLLVLALLAGVLKPSRPLLALCCVLAPWIDERFILALPLVLVCRQCLHTGGAAPGAPGNPGVPEVRPWQALGRDLAVAAAASLPYLLFRLLLMALGDTVSSDYLHDMRAAYALSTPWRLFLGWWMSLRMGWLLVAAAVALAWLDRRRLIATWMVVIIAALSVASLFMAADLTRNFCLMIPAAVTGLLLWQERRPRMARRVAVALAALQLALPAAHVFWAAVEPIQTLAAELQRRPPDELTADYHIDRGLRLRKLGDGEAARTAFDLAIRIDARSAAAHANRGLLALQRNQPAQARADLDQAVALDPNWPEGWLSRAIYFEQQSQWDAAVTDLNSALRVAAPDWPARPQVERRIAALRQRGGEAAAPRAGPSTTQPAPQGARAEP
jgi:tetratricopeptide (TPR) repeat protein